MPNSVQKICSTCGCDVSASKRVKDTQGRYHCQTCWNDAKRAAKGAATANVSSDERNPIPLIVALITVGVVIVLSLSWLLYFRPSWEDQHKSQMINLLTEADALAANGRSNDAYRKYSDLFNLIGDNSITDTDLEKKLTSAKTTMVKLESVPNALPLVQMTPVQTGVVPKTPSSNQSPTALFGDQLKPFTVDNAGVISSSTERAIYLPGTEGKDFVVSGEMWLSGGASQFDLGGVLFHLREQNGMHRYEVSAGGLRVKRVLLEGNLVAKYANPIQFSAVPRDQWVPFRIQVAQSGIVVVLGNQRGEARGPLSTDGRNSIDLSAGGKVRSLQLQVGHGASQPDGQSSSATEPQQVPTESVERGKELLLIIATGRLTADQKTLEADRWQRRCDECASSGDTAGGLNASSKCHAALNESQISIDKAKAALDELGTLKAIEVARARQDILGDMSIPENVRAILSHPTSH